jgi:putative tricarboxylic transport membrane protein
VVPAEIGVILGPTSEGQLRLALQVSNGEWSTLWATGFSITVYAVIVGILGWAAYGAVRRKTPEPA